MSFDSNHLELHKLPSAWQDGGGAHAENRPPFSAAGGWAPTNLPPTAAISLLSDHVDQIAHYRERAYSCADALNACAGDTYPCHTNSSLRHALSAWCSNPQSLHHTISIERTWGPIREWKTKWVTDMSELFFAPTEGTHFFLETVFSSVKWDFGNVTNMRSMFRYCKKIKQPLPESFDTSNVTDMGGMFSGCSAFNQALPASFDTSKVVNMRGMFRDCKKFNQPLPKSFDTSNVIDTESMFYDCSAFNQALPESFDTSNVTNMKCMFKGCTSYAQMLPSSFVVSENTDTEGIFAGCKGPINCRSELERRMRRGRLRKR